MISITIAICAIAFAAYVYLSHNKIAERKVEAMLAKWKVKEEKATVKSIKYSILYMKAIKALQEAQTRIETLETKVKALEDA